MAPPADLVQSDINLYRRVDEPEVTRYMVAYRAITLLSFKNAEGIKFPSYKGTPRLNLDEGAKARATIHIHAEDVYIYAGSIFEFPGKTVILTANRIFLVQGAGSSASEVKFDLKGTPGSGIDPPTAVPPSPLVQSNNEFSDHVDQNDNVTYTVKINKGIKGNDGKNNDSPGGAGGSLVVYGRLINLANTPISLAVDCSGGVGADGQVGGAGQGGGKGVEFTSRANITAADVTVKDGATGGNGGKGGNGSQGGNGGYVVDLLVSNPSGSRAATQALDMAKVAVDAGTPGNGKGGGAGGAGGNAGSYQPWRAIWHHKKIPYITRKYGDKVAGVAGKAGDAGAPGTAGALNTKHGCVLTASKDADSKVISAFRGMSLDLYQLSMVLRRLEYEFQLINSAQGFDADNTPPAAAKGKEKEIEKKSLAVDLQGHAESFSTTVVWLREAFASLKSSLDAVPADLLTSVTAKGNDGVGCASWASTRLLKAWGDQRKARGNLIKAFELSAFDLCPSNFVDMYGFRLGYIPQPNISMAHLAVSIKDLQELEDTQGKVWQALGAVQAQRDQVSAMAGKLEQDIAGHAKAREGEIKKLSDQYDVVVRAIKDVGDQKTRVVKMMENFWAQLKDKFSCEDVKGVLEALSNVMLFAHGDLTKTFKIGAVTSVLTATSKLGENVDTDNGPVRKDALHGKLYVLQRDLNEAGLLGAITAANKDILSLKGAGDKYVQAIIADRDAFKKLADEHFGTLRSKAAGEDKTKAAIDAAEAAFNDLVGGAQVLHQAVFEYNRLVLAFTKSERANEEAKDALASLQAHGGTQPGGTQPGVTTQPGVLELDFLSRFYADRYALAKARVMRLMFNAVKAYNAALLKRCTVLDSLIEHGSFALVTADSLRSICVTDLAAEVDRFVDSWVDYPPTTIEPPHVIELSATARPALFDKLRADRRVPFFIDARNAVSTYGFHAYWFDVRLLEVYPYLLGATNTLARPDNPATQTIDVGIEMGGVFSVWDELYHEFTFETRRTSDTFRYSYAGGKYVRGAYKTQPELSRFQFALSNERHPSADFSTPLRSPVSSFTFWVDEHVDVSKVTGLRIELKLQVRESRHERPKA